MSTVDKLQELPKEEAQKIIFSMLNSRAISALVEQQIDELSKDTLRSHYTKRSIEANNTTDWVKRAVLHKKADKSLWRHVDAKDKVTSYKGPVNLYTPEQEAAVKEFNRRKNDMSIQGSADAGWKLD